MLTCQRNEQALSDRQVLDAAKQLFGPLNQVCLVRLFDRAISLLLATFNSGQKRIKFWVVLKVS